MTPSMRHGHPPINLLLVRLVSFATLGTPAALRTATQAIWAEHWEELAMMPACARVDHD